MLCRFDEAVGRKLIQKPLALHTAMTAGLMTSSGQIIDSTASGGLKRLTLMEAVNRGHLSIYLLYPGASIFTNLELKLGSSLSVISPLFRPVFFKSSSLFFILFFSAQLQ